MLEDEIIGANSHRQAKATRDTCYFNAARFRDLERYSDDADGLSRCHEWCRANNYACVQETLIAQGPERNASRTP